MLATALTAQWCCDHKHIIAGVSLKILQPCCCCCVLRGPGLGLCVAVPHRGDCCSGKRSCCVLAVPVSSDSGALVCVEAAGPRRAGEGRGDESRLLLHIAEVCFHGTGVLHSAFLPLNTNRIPSDSVLDWHGDSGLC